ncbi:MAG TPA: hypothetical protein VHF22_15935, partial [Planctomycetota bacterium]|nr:hypothetical protein [Planctomycetota bacterium]
MGIFSRAKALILGAVDAPALGPTTKRSSTGLGPQDHLFAQQQAEKFFGPFNPRFIPDWVLKRMLTDWSIGFCREIKLSGLGAVDYFFEGGSPEIRGFCEAVCSPHLAQWREKQLQALDYGRQTIELVWQVEDVAYSYARSAGELVETTRPGAYTLGEHRDLDPETVELIADELGDFDGIRAGGVEIPPERLLHVVNESEFGSLLGRAQQARAYIPWWRGNYDYLLLDRYLEKKGDPPIIAHAPGGYVLDEHGNPQSPIRVTAIGLSNLRSGSSYVFPQEFDLQAKQPLYSARVLEVAQRAPEFLQVIERHEQNKRLACLIPAGLGTGGSFASDKVSQQLIDRFFDRWCQALVLDPINKFVIPRLVRVNFPGATAADMPKLRAGNMSINARETFAELYRSAMQLRGVTPDGRVANIAQFVDWMKGLRKVNVPTVPTELIPDAPPAPEGGYPTAGRPPAIAPETGRPHAPGRPGQVALADIPATPASWLAAVRDGLRRIDETVWRAQNLAESERQALEAQI